jgi:predicted dehydrogenase
MIKVGIIGLGFMAATHLRAYQQISGVNIAALCNPSGRNLDGDFSKVSGNIDTGTPVKLDMGRIKTYRDVGDLLENPEVHLVDICTPTVSHGLLATRALRAGKHVLCEKPLARTVQAAREIVAAAEAAPGFFMPAMCLRFWPEWAWLKGTIASQRFGRVLAARFRRVAEPPGWGRQTFMNGKESGGALFDLHIHDTDFVHYCFGRPRSVFSTGYSKVSGAVDHVVTQYEIAEGVTVHAEGGWAMTKGFGFHMAYTVNFEKATADYDLARGEEALKVYEEGKEPLVVRCEGPDGYVRELKYLVDSIASNRAPVIVTARDALVSVQICEAEEQSVRSGQPISLGD